MWSAEDALHTGKRSLWFACLITEYEVTNRLYIERQRLGRGHHRWLWHGPELSGDLPAYAFGVSVQQFALVWCDSDDDPFPGA